MKLKSVTSRKVASILQERGFKIVRTDVNPYHTNFKVFLFEATPDFLQAFEEIMKEWSKQ